MLLGGGGMRRTSLHHARLLAGALILFAMVGQSTYAQTPKPEAKPSGGATSPKPDSPRPEAGKSDEEVFEIQKDIRIRKLIETIDKNNSEITKELFKCPPDLDKVRRLQAKNEDYKKLIKGEGFNLLARFDPAVRRQQREEDKARDAARQNPKDSDLKEQLKKAEQATQREVNEAVGRLLREFAAALGDAPPKPEPACPPKERNAAPSFEPPPIPYTPPKDSPPDDFFIGFGMRAANGQTSLEERFLLTGVKTFESNPANTAFAVTGEFGYVRSFAPNWFAGVVASLTRTNLDTTHRFANGASLGTTIDGYGAVVGQAGYWASPQLALFVEAGGAFANETLNVSFAPVLSRSAIVPGVLIGGGAKVRLGRSAARFTVRYNHISFNAIDGVPPGGLFSYSGRTTINSFRAGVEFPLGSIFRAP